ncbi:hypothetical protein GIS00_00515 [Nakamurella sp. YIM 132087]|uniref:MaoC-like domain-containing protein n=1 Tax=Nakamurella alba TaxID=2665158 RepID=A0A7K1FE90_9ACTN|nr:MaoC/PaaZ C-terminal domain-containing protein [Nakamurella alba]MTD12425.1 hypothetical protein [Nakamurella alba]
MTTTVTSADPLPRTVGPVSRTDIVRYQGASGDFNPIHHDDGFARAAGYPEAFAVGMLPAGLLAGYATSIWGAQTIRRFRARFREQVWPGDVLHLSARVVGEIASGAGETRNITVELVCARQGGGVAVSATAEFELPPHHRTATDMGDAS